MAERITDRTRLVYIANPNNPTGTMVTQDAFDAFLLRVPDRVVVAVDEAYYEYVERPDYPDAIAAVRRLLWCPPDLSMSRHNRGYVQIPAALLRRLTDTLCYAA